MRIKENKERKGLKIDGERFFEKLPCLLNRQKTGFLAFKRGENNPAKPITNLC
jgi:hypothetical protein